VSTHDHEHTCLSCGYRFQAATNVKGTLEGAPEPGSFSLCIRCGHLAIFDEELRLRALTDEERTIAAQIPQLNAAQIYIRGRRRGE
jgi:hypothetical protein